MTKASFGFIISGIFLYFLASQTQIGWLYLFDSLIWGLLILSAIISRYSISSLKVERKVMLPSRSVKDELAGPLEDETIEVLLKVTNQGRLARYFVRLTEECPFEKPERKQRAFFIGQLRPRVTTTFSYQATCHKRGHYKQASIALKSSDPLGLFVRRHVTELPLNLTVYPGYYRMEKLPTAETYWLEQGQALKSQAAAEFYGSREYQPGDPLKHIHWRNGARTGHFMLKEFEQSTQGPIAVAFYIRHDFGEDKETTLEYSIKIAASLARLSAESGIGIDIFTGQGTLHNAGWQQSMEFLARLEAGGKPFTELPEVVPGQTVVLIIPAAESSLFPALLRTERTGQRTIVVLLNGFSPDEPGQEVSNRFIERGNEVVNCSRGSLEEAVESLDSSLLHAHQQVRTR
jgi:uncharacterized protein (DUF58 family)